jgi:hypothetical protein
VHLVCISCVSLEHVLKIYSKEEIVWRISWMQQSFGESEIMMTKVSKVQKPYFLRDTWAVVSQGMYICGMNKDRAHTVDEVM